MSVTTTVNRVNYIGDGASLVFAFPYLFLASTDLVVIVNGATITTGYSVTGAGDDDGGNVTFLVAPATGVNVTIYRAPDQLQNTVLSPNDPFPAKTVERMSDKLTLLIQRLFELSGRSIRLSDADVTTTSTSLPSPVANNLIGWNSSNTGLQNIDPATFSGLITYGTWTAQTFDGDGVTTDFVLASDPSSAANVDCAIGGVVKRTVIDYAIVAPNTVRITPAPPAGTDNVFFRWGSALPVGVADSVVGQTTIGTQLIQAADVAAVQSIVDSVNKTGAQTKSGVLTFTSSPVVPTPTNGTDAANKAYVGDAAASGPLAVDATVSSNAMTLTLQPCSLKFRSATLGDGSVNTRTISSAITTVISSGSTGGTVSGVQSRIVLLAIDNAGTVELAWVNQAGGNNLDETTLISTTAEGGAGAADSISTIYSTTARSSVPFRVVGYIESTQATAGTWATAPSKIQGAGGEALAANQSLGQGQVWVDVTASRSTATTYYNTTGKPIVVSVCLNRPNQNLSAAVGGVSVVSTDGAATAGAANASFIVPPSASYVVTGTSVKLWSELR